MDFVITGIGLYNGLGKTARTSFSSLLDGESTIVPISWPDFNHDTFPQSHKAVPATMAGLCPEPKDSECVSEFMGYWRHWDPATRAGLLTVEEAVLESGIDSCNVGIIFSTFAGGPELRSKMLAALNQGKRYSPRKSLNISREHMAAQVAAIYDFNGPNYSMTSACATGIVSIDTACAQLRANPELDAMVVGAADKTANALEMYWFNLLNAMSPTGVSAPFDKSRNGFVMGEGAATLIIEPFHKAFKRKANILAFIRGCGIVTKFDSDTSPDPEGEGAYECMMKACKNALIDPSDIDYVNAHATSTPVGDMIELRAISRLLGEGKQVPVVSNKGQIGHTMSACGLIEIIYTILAMDGGISPGNANLIDPEISFSNINLLRGKSTIRGRYAMKNSFGFGGRNASIIIERV